MLLGPGNEEWHKIIRSKQCKTIIGEYGQWRAEKEKDENIWSAEEKKGEEGIGGKIFLENIWFAEEKKYGEGKGGFFWWTENRPTELI